MSFKVFEDLLRISIRTFYDEVAVVVIEYILFHGNIEEHKMSEDLSLPFKQVRQALLELNQHQILTYKEGKKDRRHEERSGNMFTRGPDIGKMIYWTFDPDIKNVICCRIINLRKALDNLLDEAQKTVYICPTCNKLFSIEEAVPDFKCNICPHSNLGKKESNIAEARQKREQGIQQIKHMESLMRECIDVTLPSSFFGALPDSNERPGEKSVNIRVAKPPAGSRGFIITVNLPEAELESRDTVAMTNQHDQELLKYYQRLDKKEKRKKAEEHEEQEFDVQGQKLKAGLINYRTQAVMSQQEFDKYYEWRNNSFLFL